MEDILPEALINNGVIAQNTIIMIMMLPIIATIIGFVRHIIGLKSLGLYAPIILTFAYFQLAVSIPSEKWIDRALYGFKIGIILTLVVFITSYIAHWLTKKIRLHYFPKIALILTAVAFSFYILIIIAHFTQKTTFLKSGFLPMILIATVSEQFVAIFVKKHFKTTFKLASTTVITSYMAFLLVIYQPFQNLLILHPYLIFITIIFNFVIGKFTGLRITEYIRFKSILRK